MRKDAAGRALVGYEAKDVRPDKDFLVYYSLSKDDVGLSFLSWEGPDGGYFMFLASPRFAAPGERVVAKNVVLVLDSSGSMSGTKIRQAKEAARFVLNHLGRGDEFTLVDFDDGVTAFSEGLVPATAENVGRALKFVDGHRGHRAARTSTTPSSRPCPGCGAATVPATSSSSPTACRPSGRRTRPTS